MKITRRKLNILIESFLNEIDPKILNKAGGLGTLGGLAPLFAREASIYSGVILDTLLPYDAAKREAQTRDADKYFHYLAFMNAVSSLSLDDEEIRDKFDTIGNAKEFLDAINPFGATPITKVGYDASISEWKKDMASNNAGIEAGLAIRKGGKPGKFINDAYKLLVHTPNDMARLSKKYTPEEALKKIKESYQWAYDTYPELYADDKVFIQPRYNAKLSPLQRRDAWKRWEKRNGKAMPTWVEKLTGPLTI
jgi:hypothetical protein